MRLPHLQRPAWASGDASNVLMPSSAIRLAYCMGHLKIMEFWGCTLKFGSTAKIPAKCKLKHYRISEWDEGQAHPQRAPVEACNGDLLIDSLLQHIIGRHRLDALQVWAILVNAAAGPGIPHSLLPILHRGLLYLTASPQVGTRMILASYGQHMM